MVHALIVGTGDMAYGLCLQFTLYSSTDEKQPGGSKLADDLNKPTLEVASTSSSNTSSSNDGFFHDTKVPMVDINVGLGFADIVILAIPSAAIRDFVALNFEQIKDKVIVDITNPEKKTQNVRNALEEVYKLHGIDYQVRWVKGLNDIGALDLITRKASSKKKVSTILSGDDTKALETVKSFLEDALSFEVGAVLRSSFANELERNQASIGWEWIHTFYIMLFVHAATYSYISIRVIKGFGTPTDGLPVSLYGCCRCTYKFGRYSTAKIPTGLPKQSSIRIYGNHGVCADSSSWHLCKSSPNIRWAPSEVSETIVVVARHSQAHGAGLVLFSLRSRDFELPYI